MNHKVGAFCALLDSLHRAHAKWSRDAKGNPTQRRLNAEVGKKVRIVEYTKLTSIISRAKSDHAFELGQKDGLLFLRPPDGERALLPVLGFSANFAEGVLRIRMALFTFDDANTEAVAIGFRFETPEGP